MSKAKYGHILSAFFGGAWAIQPEKYHAIAEVLLLRAAGGRVAEEDIAAAKAARAQQGPTPGGAVLVVPVVGVISQRMNLLAEFSGGTSTEQIGRVLESAVKDPAVSAIVLDVDSPGGGVFGTSELAQKIYKLRGRKPIVAVANSLAASAAYWIATAADELAVTPSGLIGSIGVFMTHLDESKADEMLGLKYTLISAGKYKVEGNPYEPLADEARQYEQKLVDGYYADFVNAVARNRGTTPARVRSDFGQGRVVMAADAVASGMADRIATLDQVIRDVQGRIAAPQKTSASVDILRRRLDLPGGA
jgi:signal peptide peptidase SppA